MLLYYTWDTELMSHPLGAKLGKYKHMILIAVTVAALGAYFLPLSTVFAGHNSASANQAARDSILKSHSSSPSTKSNSGTTSGSSSGSSSPTTKSNSKTSSDPPVDNTPQVGTNTGHGNSGTGNIGNGNNGNGNTGNHNNGNGNCGNNLNGNGNLGNNGNNGLGGGKYGGPRGGALCNHGVRP